MAHFEDALFAGVSTKLACEGMKYDIGDKVFVAGYASWKDEFAFEVVRLELDRIAGTRDYDLWNREYDIRLYDVPEYKLRLCKAVTFIPNMSLRASVPRYRKRPEPKKVIFHDPATIVLWTDGTKTVVKCSEGDTYDPEKGFMLCYFKKMLGESYYKYISKTVKKYKED